MEQIRAFVGHSFTDDDEAVVHSFLKYFYQISDLYPHFTWAHAEAAEPKILAEKVLSLISDKNVFIGICTRKEKVISPLDLVETTFPRGFLKAKVDRFFWKTSDWIIQEIGLAIGKQLSVILLLENGVRAPGGLQGNLEYISFDRNFPDKCFGKILEMLKALSPKPATSKAALPEAKSVPETPEEESVPSTGIDLWTPTPDWERGDFEFALLVAVREEDQQKVSATNEAFLNSKFASVPDSKERWDAFAEYIKLLFGKGGTLEKVKSMAKDHPDSSGTLEQLGLAFAHFDEHMDAGVTFERAADIASETGEEQRLLGRAALQFARAQAGQRLKSVLDRMKAGPISATPKGELRLLRTLQRVAEFQKDDEGFIAFSERLLELAPEDTKARFSLAYKHSAVKNGDLAIFHYLRTPVEDRDSSSWNNVGVEFENVGLSGKSVTAYKRSEELGETLASSNLAKRYLSAGFITEAQEKCNAALQLPTYHENVPRTLAEARSRPGEEQEKQSEILDRAKAKSIVSSDKLQLLRKSIFPRSCGALTVFCT